MTLFLIFVVGVVAVAAWTHVNAMKSNLDNLRDRVLRLQGDLKVLERQVRSLEKRSPQRAEFAEELERISEPAPTFRARPAVTVAATGSPPSEVSTTEAAAPEEPTSVDTDEVLEERDEREVVPAGVFASVRAGVLKDSAPATEVADSNAAMQVVGAADQPVEAESAAGGADSTAASPEAVMALDEAAAGFEAKLGTVWTLRVGLGLLAIAAAYYARAIFPTLPPGWKVAIAYAGAAALFAVGRVFEKKLARFAKPVMAGGLALGFFVSYAAYFVTPMRAVTLPVSLAWMTAGVVAILIFAERWRSQPLAALAIVLGHTSAYVAAGSADSFSLVIITALSIVAVALLVRHGWVELALFGTVTAYAAHILWSLAEHPPVAADRAYWVNVAFFASYYVVFLIGDIIWWRRVTDRSGSEYRRFEPLAGRLIGPLNVTLFLSAVSYLYVATNVYLTDIHWFFFVLAAVQEAHGRFHRLIGNDDYVFYPAVGTILVTLGFISAFEALSLNLVLAVEALLLLILAHRTRVWIFHLLAQITLALNFIHSWFYGGDATDTIPTVVGMVAVVAVYMVMAWLEDRWYGPGGDLDWDVPRVNARLPFDSASRYLAERFDEFYSTVTPYLSYVHAAAGSLIFFYQAGESLAVSQALALVTAVSIALLVVALVFRSAPLVVGYFVLLCGNARLAYVWPHGSDWISWAPVTAGAIGALVLAVAVRSLFRENRERKIAAVVSHGAIWAVIVAMPGAVFQSAFSGSMELLWFVPLAILFVQQERLAAVTKTLDSVEDDRIEVFDAIVGALTCVAGGVLLVALTLTVGGIAGVRAEFATPVLIALWGGVLIAAAAFRDCARLYVGGATVLALCYLLIVVIYEQITDSVLATLWVVGVTLAIAIAQDIGIAKGAADERSKRALTFTTNAAYILGLVLLLVLFNERLGFPWSVVAMAVTPFALLALFKRYHANSATWVAFSTSLLLQAGMGMGVFAGVVPAGGPILLPAAAMTALVMTHERILATRIPLPALVDEPDPNPTATLLLIVGVAFVAMIAVYRSESLVAGWVTASWSIVGAVLMILGFVWKSASYRRVALVVLALCLVRVFAVDIRNLSDQAKVLAFATLGICMIAVAWLYSRFAKDVKKWL